MKRVTVIVVVGLLGICGFAKQKKIISQPNTPAVRMQISQYMRESGLTYLELLDKAFDQATQDHLAYMRAMSKHDGSYSFLNMPTGTNLDNPYGIELSHLEDRMEINLKSEGDKKFFDFLQNTRAIAGTAYKNVLRHDPTYEKLRPHPMIGKLYPTCIGQAHFIIKEGVFSYGSCSIADYDAALKADDPEAAAKIEKEVEETDKKKK